MNNVETMLEIVSTYFGRNPLLLLCILGFIVLWKKVSRQNRIYMAVVCLCAGLFVYNDILYKLAQKIGEQNSFYRVLWIVPVVGLSAYLCIEVYGMLKYKTQRLTFVLLFAVLLFLYNNSAISNWTTLPSNIYQLPDEVIAVADVIEKDSGGERVNFCDDEKELSNLMRLYNANICVPVEHTSYIWHVWSENAINTSGRQIRSILRNAQVDYVSVKKNRIDSQKVLETGGCREVGRTLEHVVYATDAAWWAEHEKREIQSGIQEDYTCNVECIYVSGLSEETMFLYLNPKHVAENPAYVDEWKERVQNFGIEEIFIGRQRNDDRNTGLFFLMEYEDFVIMSIDNSKELSSEVLEEYDRVQALGKAIILMLEKPLNALEPDELCAKVVQADSNVRMVFASESDTYKKELLNDKIVQCSGFETWVDTTETVIIIKGQ